MFQADTGSTMDSDTISKQGILLQSVRIRPMKITDLDQVVQIDRISFSLPWPVNAYRYEIEENDTSIKFVAEIQEKGEGNHRNNTNEPAQSSRIVGMIVIWIILDEAHIATIAVHPAYRRQGIAKELVTTCLNEAKNKGMKEVTLEVRAGNLVAQALYRQFGFESVGIRPRYYKDNHEDAIIMTRRLS
jgi:ribosomal-protein-alanine N-acetyltransferase